jgi:hypothetical protein
MKLFSIFTFFIISVTLAAKAASSVAAPWTAAADHRSSGSKLDQRARHSSGQHGHLGVSSENTDKATKELLHLLYNETFDSDHRAFFESWDEAQIGGTPPLTLETEQQDEDPESGDIKNTTKAEIPSGKILLTAEEDQRTFFGSWDEAQIGSTPPLTLETEQQDEDPESGDIKNTTKAKILFGNILLTPEEDSPLSNETPEGHGDGGDNGSDITLTNEDISGSSQAPQGFKRRYFPTGHLLEIIVFSAWCVFMFMATVCACAAYSHSARQTAISDEGDVQRTESAWRTILRRNRAVSSQKDEDHTKALEMLLSEAFEASKVVRRPPCFNLHTSLSCR